MGKRERDVIDAKSCESDENFWSKRSGEDSENYRNYDSNPEKSVGLGNGRAAAKDSDGASEGNVIGRRSSTSPTASPWCQHLRLQVRCSLHAGIGGQCPLQVHSLVDTLSIQSSIHCLRQWAVEV